MKKLLLVTIAAVVVTTCADAESAHKGWAAVPAHWPAAEPPQRIVPVVRDVGMAGPGARVEEPDPPTNAVFRAGFLFKMGSTVTVERVYMLLASDDGTLRTKEIKITPLSLYKNEVITGYYAASFNTEKLSFKEGDVFVLVFKADGQITPVFLKLIYNRFVPS